jgi:hypothetical protein
MMARKSRTIQLAEEEKEDIGEQGAERGSP